MSAREPGASGQEKRGARGPKATSPLYGYNATPKDPGASTGQPIREPERCACSHLETLHLFADGKRGRCMAMVCGCREHRPKRSKSDVLDELIAERFGTVMPPDPK